MGTLAILCRTISKFALDGTSRSELDGISHFVAVNLALHIYNYNNTFVDKKNMADIQNQLLCILSLPWLHQISDETFRQTVLANDANWMAAEPQPSTSTSLGSSMSCIMEAVFSALNYQLTAASQAQAFDVFKGLACWANLKAVCLPFIAAMPFAGKNAMWFVNCYVSSLSFVETDLAARTCAWQLLPVMYLNSKEASSRTALLEAAR